MTADPDMPPQIPADSAGDPPDIDRYIDPAQVLGVEVYGAGGAPPQYQAFDGAAACGVILIWSKR